MKRYAVFSADRYYPGGGWNDFLASFDDVDEAIAAARKRATRGDAASGRWAHVVDLHTGEMVLDA